MTETADGKRVFVKFDNGRAGEEVLVTPGITVNDLLQNFGVEPNQYSVSKGNQSSVFGTEEPIFPSVADGDVLYITSIVDAGKIYA